MSVKIQFPLNPFDKHIKQYIDLDKVEIIFGEAAPEPLDEFLCVLMKRIVDLELKVEEISGEKN